MAYSRSFHDMKLCQAEFVMGATSEVIIRRWWAVRNQGLENMNWVAYMYNFRKQFIVSRRNNSCSFKVSGLFSVSPDDEWSSRLPLRTGAGWMDCSLMI